MINNWVGIGRLGQPPELRYLPSGAAVCNASIAISNYWKDKHTGERKEKTSWIPLTIFGKQAENLANWCKKGTKIGVSGNLEEDRWEEQDGKKRSKIHVKVFTFEVLSDGVPKDDQGGSRPQPNRPPDSGPPGGYDDEIPF